MRDGHAVSDFYTTVVRINFVDEYSRFVFAGAGDDATAQQAGRNSCVRLVQFPNGDGITCIVLLLDALVYQDVGIRSDDEHRVHGIADDGHAVYVGFLHVFVRGYVQRFQRFLEAGLGLVNLDFPETLYNLCA